MKLFTKDNKGTSLIKLGSWQKCCVLRLIELKDVFLSKFCFWYTENVKSFIVQTPGLK
jgi:hypothetical protein